MTKALLDVQQLVPAQWQVLRDVRLRALSDSPHFFTADPDLEGRLTERQWRHRVKDGVWVVARDRGRTIGIAGLVRGHWPHPGCHVESIWVDPGHRNCGVFRSLLADLVEKVRANQDRHLFLWVLDDNTVARAVYTRLGFVPTGQRQAIVGRPDRFEIRLRFALTDARLNDARLGLT